MASSTAFGDLDARRRDACPSAHIPFDAADGALLRLRIPGGSVTSAGLRTIAAAASHSSNGIVELTNRANVQLRGFATTEAQRALALLIDAGLVLEDGEADARRNVIGSPLAGLDPDELCDVRDTVHEITKVLAAWTGPISPKFGVIVDGGGTANLRGRRHDIVLGAVRHRGRVVFEVALGDGLPAGLATESSTAGTSLVVERADATRLVLATLDFCEPGERPVDLVRRLGRSEVLAVVGAAIGGCMVEASTLERPASVGTAPIGIGDGWVGAAPLLGRLGVSTTGALADLADEAGQGEVRITPWRGIVIHHHRTDDPVAIRLRLDDLGMCTDDQGAVLDVIACAGNTGCASGEADAQADARALLAILDGKSVGPVHVSGCAKRCASRLAIGLTLVAEAGRYDVFDGDHCVAQRLSPHEAIAFAGRRSL